MDPIEFAINIFIKLFRKLGHTWFYGTNVERDRTKSNRNIT